MSEDNDKNLPTLSGDISPDDVDKLDIDKLKSDMLKGIYTLESALFSQASFEFGRIGVMRELISDLEKELFDPVTMKAMTPDMKIKLYQVIMKNMGDSMKFMQDLHRNVESGLSTVSSIERLKDDNAKSKKPVVDVTSPELDKIKSSIQEIIKSKVLEDKSKDTE